MVRLVLCVSFSALTLMIEWEQGHLTCENPIPAIPIGSVLEQVEEYD